MTLKYRWDLTWPTSHPHDTKAIFRTIGQANSGFVHGASVHILEMYGGADPHFHVEGMNNTPRVAELIPYLWDYFYRGLLQLIAVAHCLKADEQIQNLYELRGWIEKKSGKTEWSHPEQIMKKLKNKKIDAI